MAIDSGCKTALLWENSLVLLMVTEKDFH
jgi:hypothetical protein